MKKTLSIRPINGVNYHFIRIQYLNKPDVFYCNNVKIDQVKYERGVNGTATVIRAKPATVLPKSLVNIIELFSKLVKPLASFYPVNDIIGIRKAVFDLYVNGLPFYNALQRALYFHEGHINGGNPAEAMTRAENILDEISIKLNT
jgi:hypothetical protein